MASHSRKSKSCPPCSSVSIVSHFLIGLVAVLWFAAAHVVKLDGQDGVDEGLAGDGLDLAMESAQEQAPDDLPTGPHFASNSRVVGRQYHPDNDVDVNAESPNAAAGVAAGPTDDGDDDDEYRDSQVLDPSTATPMNLNPRAASCFLRLVGALRQNTFMDLLSEADSTFRGAILDNPACMHYAQVYSSSSPAVTSHGSRPSPVGMNRRQQHERRRRSAENFLLQHGNGAVKRALWRQQRDENQEALSNQASSKVLRRVKRGDNDRKAQYKTKFQLYINDSLQYSRCGPICSIELKAIFTKMVPGCVSEDRKCCSCIAGAIAYQIASTAIPGFPG